MIGLAGVALALVTVGQAEAQVAPGQVSLADLPVSATQNGRTVASTRTDPRIPPPAVACPTPRAVIVTGTLSLEPSA